MSNVNFFVEGTLKIEILVCSHECRGICMEKDCPNERKEVKVLEEIIFYLPEQKTLTVKPGFVFDGASIPQICWTSIGHPLEHRFILAALLHDALYQTQYLSRKKADEYFQKFLKEFAGVGKYTVWKMFTGVRLFGGIAWASKTEKSISDSRKAVIIGDTE